MRHSIEYNNLVALGSEGVTSDQDLPARHRGKVVKINGNIQYRLGGFVPGQNPLFANIYTLRQQDLTSDLRCVMPDDNIIDYPAPINDDQAALFQAQLERRMDIGRQLYPRLDLNVDLFYNSLKNLFIKGWHCVVHWQLHKFASSSGSSISHGT